MAKVIVSCIISHYRAASARHNSRPSCCRTSLAVDAKKTTVTDALKDIFSDIQKVRLPSSTRMQMHLVTSQLELQQL